MNTKRFFAWITAAALMLSLAACTEKPPAESDGESKVTASSQEPYSSDAGKPETPPQKKPARVTGGTGTLEDYYAWAQNMYPDAAGGIAFIGSIYDPHQELFVSMDSDGWFPFAEEIPEERRIGKLDDYTEIWCIAPASPESVVTVYEQYEDNTGSRKRGEKLYTAAPGEPVLFFCGSDTFPTPYTADITAPDGTTATLCPEMSPTKEWGEPELPADGSAFDFTLRNGQGELFDWQLCGSWRSEGGTSQWVPEWKPAGDGPHAPIELRTTLTLQDDGQADYVISEAGGEFIGSYSGTWSRENTAELNLELAHEKGEMLQYHGRNQKNLSGSCGVLGGYNDTLLVRCGEGSIPLAGSGEDPDVPRVLVMAPAEKPQSYEPYNGAPWVRDAKTMALNYHEAETGFAEGAVLRRSQNEELLIEVYLTAQSCRVSCGWYWINPYEKTGTDWLTGEEIDFGIYAVSDQFGCSLQEAALSVYLTEFDPEDKTHADQVRIEGADDNLWYATVLTSGNTGYPEHLVWFEVNAETRMGRDAGSDGEFVLDFGQFMPLDIDPTLRDYLSQLALGYYEQNAGYRPQYADVTDVADGRASIHLYDDMGDHTATCTWYNIDLETFTGIDEMSGEHIDLNEAAVG